VFLEIEGMKKEHVVYIKMNKPFISETGNRLWAGETWYTLNNIPQIKGEPGKALIKKNNLLLPEEEKDGWKVLFDEQMLKHGIRYSDNSHENFEMEIEWKADEGADGGIFYRVPQGSTVQQLKQFPEMQIADDENNHASKESPKHLSGGVGGRLSPAYKLYRPGEFNHSRLIVKGDSAEHWLNGTRVVKYKTTDKKSGHIALVVEKGNVTFRNARIRQLNTGK
jgi:cytochrome c